LNTSILALELEELNYLCFDGHLPIGKGAKLSGYQNCERRLHIFSSGEACAQ